MKKARISIIMGSKSDWETMQHCAKMLETLSIKHEVNVYLYKMSLVLT